MRNQPVTTELASSDLVPAMINQATYSIPRVRYSKGSLNTISVDLTMADGVIPGGVNAYSSRQAILNS